MTHAPITGLPIGQLDIPIGVVNLFCLARQGFGKKGARFVQPSKPLVSRKAAEIFNGLRTDNERIFGLFFMHNFSMP